MALDIVADQINSVYFVDDGISRALRDDFIVGFSFSTLLLFTDYVSFTIYDAVGDATPRHSV